MDLTSLRERGVIDAFSVSQINNYIKNLIDGDRILSAVTIKGEISNFTSHRSGHLYFSLKDADGQIKAVMFRYNASRLKFLPESGMKVIAHGSISVFPRDGSYQFYVTSLQPDGIGALYLAYEQLKTKLSSEGLFDSIHKQALPKIPERIGLITSPTGAAVRDIINVLRRRFPLAGVYLYPALVQGLGAERDLIDGIDYFDKSGLVDVVIIGRGGGSIEDLWSFNSEALARKIFAAKIPVISAVGHETDFTICDFVSDMRAPTPSAAAELAVPDIREILQRIDSYEERCASALYRYMELAKERLARYRDANVFDQFKNFIIDRQSTVDEMLRVSNDHINRFLTCAKHNLAVSSEKIVAMNPLTVLARGYSVAECRGTTISDSGCVEIGDIISVRLANGRINAKVTDIEP